MPVGKGAGVDVVVGEGTGVGVAVGEGIVVVVGTGLAVGVMVGAGFGVDVGGSVDVGVRIGADLAVGVVVGLALVQLAKIRLIVTRTIGTFRKLRPAPADSVKMARALDFPRDPPPTENSDGGKTNTNFQHPPGPVRRQGRR